MPNLIWNLKSGITSHILGNIYKIFNLIYSITKIFYSIQIYCARTYSFISKYSTFCKNLQVSHKTFLSKFQNILLKVLAVFEDNMLSNHF